MTLRPLELIAGPLGVPGWLSEAEALCLRAAVLSTTGAIVETGTWAGRSLLTIAAARAEQGTTHTRPLLSVDPYPDAGQAEAAAAAADDPEQRLTPHEARELCHALLSRFGVTNVWWCNLPALAAAAFFRAKSVHIDDRMNTPMSVPWPKKAPPVGLLYLDDHHEGGYVRDEIAAWLPHLADECEILFHDFYHEPYGLEPVVAQFLLEHPEWVRVEERLSMYRIRRRFRRAKLAPAHAHKVEAFNVAGSPRITYVGGGAIRSRMPPPKVSVLYNTWRLGGLDLLKAGLDRQTLPPDQFEVVLVDALFPYRYEAVNALFGGSPYVVKHVNVSVNGRVNPFPLDHGNLARNVSIKHAEGEVCVWWCDYSLADRRSLARHLEVVTETGGTSSSCGVIVYGQIELEALHPDFRALLPIHDIDHYVEILEGLPADSPLWTSIFDGEPRALGRRQLIHVQEGDGLPYDLRGVRATEIPWLAVDQRFRRLQGPLGAADLYYAKNEATAHDLLVKVNGWDESFDGGHTNDDTDMGRRLTKAGDCMILDKGNECFVPNPRPFFPFMRWERTPLENRRLFHVLKDLDRPRAIRGLVDELHLIPKPTTSPTVENREAARVS